MKREIKFRAWHKLDGYMILPEQCEKFEINFTPKCFKGFSFWIKFKGSGELLGSDKHIDLMQYTGLKDKNGIEIYEGDIVNVFYVTPMGRLTNDIDHKSHIVFQTGMFCLKEYPVNIPITKYCHRHEGEYVANYGIPKILHEETILEVIGNIYENIELIQGEREK